MRYCSEDKLSNELRDVFGDLFNKEPQVKREEFIETKKQLIAIVEILNAMKIMHELITETLETINEDLEDV
jgi:hypothetical protein